jgi:hypothetical protein
MKEKIAGCVVAQRITTARELVISTNEDGDNNTTSTGPLTVSPNRLPTSLGIARLFVSSKSRRMGIANALLDSAAETFIHGCPLDPNNGDVAFTQPTGAGEEVMKAWGGGKIRVYEETDCWNPPDHVDMARARDLIRTIAAHARTTHRAHRRTKSRAAFVPYPIRFVFRSSNQSQRIHGDAHIGMPSSLEEYLVGVDLYLTVRDDPLDDDELLLWAETEGGGDNIEVLNCRDEEHIESAE